MRGARMNVRGMASLVFSQQAFGVVAAELAAVGVAAHGDGQRAEMVGEQDEAGAGAEGGQTLGDALGRSGSNIPKS